MTLVLLLGLLFTPIPRTLTPPVDIAPAAPVTRVIGGQVAVASDGQHFLVTSVSLSQPQFRSSEVVAMLVDAAGQPLLPASWNLGTTIADEAGAGSSGRTYLVAWGALGRTDAALFDNNGEPLRPVFQLHPATRPMLLPRDGGGSRNVVWDGTQYVVLSRLEVVNGSRIDAFSVATFVDEQGTILRNDIPVAGFNPPEAAARNGRTVLASFGVEGVSIQSLLSNGTTSSVHTIPVSGALSVAVAASPESYVVVWTTSAGVFVQPISASGEPAGAPFRISDQGGREVSATWNGTHYVIAWVADPARLVTMRLAGATPLDPAPVPQAEAVVAQETVSNGSATLLAWSSNLTVAKPLGGSDAEATPVHRYNFERRSPFLAAYGGDLAAIWVERDRDIFHRSLVPQQAPRIIRSGLPLAFARGAGGTIVVSTQRPGLSALVNEQFDFSLSPVVPTHARAVAIGNEFAVAWHANDELVLARVRSDGTIADRRVVATSPFVRELAIAASRDRVLVGWYSETSGLSISIDGNTPVSLGGPALLANRMSIASDGEDFLVTWISKGHEENNFVQGQLVSPDGTPLGATHIYTLGGDFKDSLHTFWTGENYLAIYAAGNDNIEGVRIDGGGNLLDYPPVVLGNIGTRLFQAALVSPTRIALTHIITNEPFPKAATERTVLRWLEVDTVRRRSASR
ncbi:MAG TPA: hypothetical protein VF618_13240 [Thermoanaerobaculia bacterium]